MFAMFKQLFLAIQVLFVASEKGAKAVEHLATWAEESAGAFADEARIGRKYKLNQMQLETGVTLAVEDATVKSVTNERTKLVK